MSRFITVLLVISVTSQAFSQVGQPPSMPPQNPPSIDSRPETPAAPPPQATDSARTPPPDDPFLHCVFEQSQEAIDAQVPSTLLARIRTLGTTLASNNGAQTASTACQTLGQEITLLTEMIIGAQQASANPNPGGTPEGAGLPGGNTPSGGGRPPGENTPQNENPPAGGTKSVSSGGLGGEEAPAPTASTTGGTMNCYTDPAQCHERLESILRGSQNCSQQPAGLGDAIMSLALSMSPYIGPAGSLIALGAGTLRSIYQIFTRSSDRNNLPDVSALQRARMRENLEANIACMANKVYYNSVCVDARFKGVRENAPRGQESFASFDAEDPACGSSKRFSLQDEGQQAVTAVYECLDQVGRVTTAARGRSCDDACKRRQCFRCNRVVDGGEQRLLTQLDIINIQGRASEAAAYLSVQANELAEFLDFSRDYHKRKITGLYNAISENGRNGAVSPDTQPYRYQMLIQHCYRGFVSRHTQQSTRSGNWFRGERPTQGYSPASIVQEPEDRQLEAICRSLDQCLPEESPFGQENFTSPDGSSFRYDSISVCEGIHKLEVNNVIDDGNNLLMAHDLIDRRFGQPGGCQERPATRGAGGSRRGGTSQ